MSTFSLICPDRIGSLAILGLLVGGISPAFGSQAKDGPVFEPKIVVLLGEGGINVVKQAITASPLVEVRDQYDAPIVGAEVRFALPRSGPGGMFEDGTKELSRVADPLGRADMGEMRPTGRGLFKITVSASYKGRTASTAILQINFPTVASAKKAGKTPGTSVSTELASTPVKLPSGAMAISGGKAAILVVSAAAIGGGVYYLIKNKAVPNCAAQATAAITAASGAEGVCEADGDNQSCQTNITALDVALTAFCSCGGAYTSLGISFLQTLQASYGLSLPASCSAN